MELVSFMRSISHFSVHFNHRTAEAIAWNLTHFLITSLAIVDYIFLQELFTIFYKKNWPKCLEKFTFRSEFNTFQLKTGFLKNSGQIVELAPRLDLPKKQKEESGNAAFQHWYSKFFSHFTSFNS